jgi:uncharacterized protein (UPF0276 family)
MAELAVYMFAHNVIIPIQEGKYMAKIEISDIDRLKQIVDNISCNMVSTDLYFSECKVRKVGNSCMLPIPKNWENKHVVYLAIPIDNMKPE